MLDVHSINLFLDEAIVDELWTLAKRDGTIVEKVRDASAKLVGKSKFGVGKLWQWMTADAELELSAEAEGKFSQKLQFTSVFRALVLPELVGDIARVGGQDGTSMDDLQQGGFVEMETNTLELVPLPTFAGFVRQMAISGAGESANDPNREFDLDTTVSFAEKLTSAHRAMTCWCRLEDSNNGSPLFQRLFTNESKQLFNALCMSNDDHVLGLSEISTQDAQVTVFSVLEERYLKRHLAAFTVERPIRIFGRVAYKAENFLGVEPVTIALS